MNDFLINLGPFNDCVDYLEDCTIAEVCTPTDSASGDLLNIFYYSKECVAVQSKQKSECLIVPMFDIKYVADYDTPQNHRKLIESVELKILNMIYDMVNKFGIKLVRDIMDIQETSMITRCHRHELKLSNIVIPIKSIDIQTSTKCFDLNNRSRLYIIVTLGIAIFTDSTVQVLG